MYLLTILLLLGDFEIFQQFLLPIGFYCSFVYQLGTLKFFTSFYCPFVFGALLLYNVGLRNFSINFGLRKIFHISETPCPLI